MADKKHILFVTGTRADFGKVKPLIARVDQSDDFECGVFVTGMHMLSRYGHTFLELEKSGFKNLFLYINQIHSSDSRMDLVLANTIEGLGRYVREFRPDLIVTHGDRVETLAAATVGALNNILVAHVEGGELSGTVDELIRHAVSKLSHVHFVANDLARRRLVQMGELESSIFVIGSPDIDVMISYTLPSLPEVKRKYEIDFSEYAIFTYHPVTTQLKELWRNIDTVVDALKTSGWNFVVVYPNNDPGADVIQEAILPLNNNSRFRVLPSMRFEYFLTLLKHARAMIGNSSAGVREAPVYGVPAINIGNRQMNRYRHEGIVDVPEDKHAILQAMLDLPRSVASSMHFGNGNSAEAFIAALKKPDLWNISCQKQFQDVAFADEWTREYRASTRR